MTAHPPRSRRTSVLRRCRRALTALAGTLVLAAGLPPGYAPMQQEGSIVLGSGGDNSNRAGGSFFESAITAGYPTDAADDAVQAGIVAAGYAGDTAGVVQPVVRALPGHPERRHRQRQPPAHPRLQRHGGPEVRPELTWPGSAPRGFLAY